MLDRKTIKQSESQSSQLVKHRGIATLWVILVVPLVLTMMCGVTDMAILLNAKVELKSGMEATALKASQTWGATGGGDTQAARDDGIEMAAANTVNGIPITISDNYTGANTNDNTSCNGDLVFGAVDISASPDIFSAGIIPQCEVNTLTQIKGTFTFQSDNLMGTLTTFKAVNGFTIEYGPNPSIPAGLTVDSITIQLPGTFQFHSGISAAVAQFSEVGNGTSDGWGPFSVSIPSTSVSYSLSSGTPTRNSSLTITFNGPNKFDIGESIIFGIDTDESATADVNGDSADGAGSFDVPGFVVTYNMSNGTPVPYDDTLALNTPAKVFLNPGQASQGGVVIPGTGEFAVMAKTTVQVESLWKTLFGVNVGPYPVFAKAVAVSGCPAGTSPQLLHVKTINCP